MERVEGLRVAGLWSIRQVAAAAGVHPDTVRALIRLELLPPREELSAVDAVVAQVAVGIGANRSTNRAVPDARTAEALARDRAALGRARELMLGVDLAEESVLVIREQRARLFGPGDLEDLADLVFSARATSVAHVFPVGRWAAAVV